MRNRESTSSVPDVRESVAFTSRVVSGNKFTRVRNIGIAFVASIPLIANGVMEAAAAPGHSATTSKEQGPRCMEVFVTTYPYESISSYEFNSWSTSAAGASLDELGVKSNVFRAMQAEPVETIVLDCSIWPGSDIEEPSS